MSLYVTKSLTLVALLTILKFHSLDKKSFFIHIARVVDIDLYFTIIIIIFLQLVWTSSTYVTQFICFISFAMCAFFLFFFISI